MMKEHMRLYKERKKAVKEIVCEDCIVRANCSEYCEDMDYLIIMCADARYQASPGPRNAVLEEAAKAVRQCIKDR